MRGQIVLPMFPGSLPAQSKNRGTPAEQRSDDPLVAAVEPFVSFWAFCGATFEIGNPLPYV